MLLIKKNKQRSEIEAKTGRITWIAVHCKKSHQTFRDITWNEEENEILHEIFRVVSRFPRYISCYIAESRFPLLQCT